VDDPDRAHAEEALEAYLPRAVYALFTLINRLDGFSPASRDRRLLSALLVSACDRANTLWAYPIARARPRQLTIPPRHFEFNVWKAMEAAIEDWGREDEAIPLVTWPETPPINGGISLFEGRLKDLVPTLLGTQLGGIATALPRPNQAFWTLSALWSAWLWGREALGPFKSALRRRRYDWAWHATALTAAYQSLAPSLRSGTPIFNLIGEAETGYLSAGVVAGEKSGLKLAGLALRLEDSQAQINWTPMETPSLSADPVPLEPEIISAARDFLNSIGEPSAYLALHGACLTTLARIGALRASDLPAGETLTEVHDQMEKALTYRAGFIRFGGSQHSLDVGQWWLRDPAHAQPPLADRVETSVLSHLRANPGITLQEMDIAMCESYPGAETPEFELVHTCLDSYGEQDMDEGAGWHLRAQEQEDIRAADLDEMRQLLTDLADRLGYRVHGGSPLVWEEIQGPGVFYFYLLASAVIGDILLTDSHPPERGLVVLPGGRANLVLYKLHRDPRLETAVNAGWRFLKFRHIRRLSDSSLLNRGNMEDQFALDPLTYSKPQIPLL
jgi:hypothetical protein